MLVRHPVAEDAVRGEAFGANLAKSAERTAVGAADDEHLQLFRRTFDECAVAARDIALRIGHDWMRCVVERLETAMLRAVNEVFEDAQWMYRASVNGWMP